MFSERSKENIKKQEEGLGIVRLLCSTTPERLGLI